MTRSRQARRLLVLFPHDLLSFTMDESGLDALADILNKIAEKPFDVALHMKYLQGPVDAQNAPRSEKHGAVRSESSVLVSR